MVTRRLLPAIGELEISPTEVTKARLRALRGPEAAVSSASLRQRVGAHAFQDPNRIAISGTKTMTYSELDHAIDRACMQLASLGIGLGDIVGVLAQRDALVPVLFIALENLGAVYLPLDASWPAARRQMVLHESRPKAVLTDREYADGDHTWITFSMSQPFVGVGTESMGADSGGRGSRDEEEARYILYTSGSSGRPKGAIVEQRGMLNHLYAKREDLSITGRDVVAFTAPLGFDISIWQMLTPLISGGVVVILDEETMRFPRRFMQEIARHEVSVAEVVPTFIEWLVTEVERGRPLSPSVRMLIATGEELHASLLKRAQRALPGVQLVNAYGPTECSDDVTHRLLKREDALDQRVPIGRPIANCALYRLVPLVRGGWRAAEAGEPAELFIGGAPVGRGYLDRPDSTAASFFRDKFDDGSVTGRLYRTGDIVTERNGVLTYLGRSDRQVKVNGTRIELDEIEAIVAATPGVRECAAWHDVDDEVVRVWAVCSDDVESDINQRLRDTLPSTVRPRVNRVTGLRRTPNGKIDYRGLVRDTMSVKSPSASKGRGASGNHV